MSNRDATFPTAVTRDTAQEPLLSSQPASAVDATSASSPASTRRAAWRRGAAVLALFMALSVVYTWPQVKYVRTGMIAHFDPLFSAWRLGWISHALYHDRDKLFEGNILYPAHRTLAYSDATLLEGVIAAPFIHAGVSPLTMVNLLWFVSLVSSAGGMYLLARRLTGSTSAAILAGIIFTFAPYRAEHNMHLELNWAQWIPLALWSLHRTLTEDRWVDGVLTGVFIALQLVSCIYYALYFLIALAIIGPLSLIAYRKTIGWRGLAGLALGGVVIVMVAQPYVKPYQMNVRTVGTRPTMENARWSATWDSYIATTDDNLLYGNLTRDLGGAEARDFPGVIAIVLLVVALWPPFKATRLIYFVGLAFAVEASLGMNGWLYPLLHRWLTPLSGLRAPGRWGILVLAMLAVLAAYGLARVQRRVGPRWSMAVTILLCGLLGIEYLNRPLGIWRYPTEPPQIYQWLARLPHPTLTIEFPLLAADPQYMYFSTMHWQPLINGYSGFRPPSYLEMTGRMDNFPDDKTIDELRRRGVRAIILHKALYGLYGDQLDYMDNIKLLAFRKDVEFVAAWKDHLGEARAYLLLNR
jgi:hypothetical protein